MAGLDEDRLVKSIKNTKIHYYPDEILGHGATASVFRGYFGNTIVEAAVKILNPDIQDVDENELKIFQRLLTNSTDSAAINIVKLFDWALVHKQTTTGSTASYMFAMELASSNLRVFMKSNLDIKLDIRKKLCLDMTNGLKFLHDNDIVHRDLKPENVLVFTKDNNIVGKLGDFGVSRILDPITASKTTIGCGAEIWMSPEAITSMHRNVKFKNCPTMDIFVLGMLMHFALTWKWDEHPFKTSKKHGNNPTMNIQTSFIDPLPLSDDNMFTEQNLLLWMMQNDPHKRPTLKNVLSHPAFWSSKICIDFVRDIACTLDDKHSTELRQIGNEMKDAYQQFRKNLGLSPINWKASVDTRLFERKHEADKPNADYRNHIVDLVKLVRDKRVHYRDIVHVLFGEQFSNSSDDICEEKYIEYFLTRFPELLIFLFSTFVSKGTVFTSIREKFFPEYTTNCLLDETVYAKYMRRNSCLKKTRKSSPTEPADVRTNARNYGEFISVEDSGESTTANSGNVSEEDPVAFTNGTSEMENEDTVGLFVDRDLTENPTLLCSEMDILITDSFRVSSSDVLTPSVKQGPTKVIFSLPVWGYVSLILAFSLLLLICITVFKFNNHDVKNTTPSYNVELTNIQLDVPLEHFRTTDNLTIGRI